MVFGTESPVRDESASIAAGQQDENDSLGSKIEVDAGRELAGLDAKGSAEGKAGKSDSRDGTEYGTNSDTPTSKTAGVLSNDELWKKSLAWKRAAQATGIQNGAQASKTANTTSHDSKVAIPVDVTPNSVSGTCVGTDVTQEAAVSTVSSVARSLPVVLPTPPAEAVQPSAEQGLLSKLPARLGLFIGQNAKVYATIRDGEKQYALPVSGRALKNHLRKIGLKAGAHLNKKDLNEIVDYLQAYAEDAGVRKTVWLRVAPIEGGIEIYLGDDAQTIVRITAGKVEVAATGSEMLFLRPLHMLPIAYPAAVGNVDLLKNHVHLRPASYKSWLGWVTYIIATPKLSTSKFPILALIGGMGTCKSSLARLSLKVIDPSSIGIQKLHGTARDLAIASQNNHVLAYDNMRAISADMSDTLCMASTGGMFSTRQLYTDDEQSAINIHVALILNGIHSFVDQPDLSQRVVPLFLEPILETLRKSERELDTALEGDLPAIQRGLYDLIAKIFEQLPNATVTHSERMIDFVRWLAAFERVDGVQAGTYQAEYSNTLKQGQLDTLQENALATAIMDLAESSPGGIWSGTPAQLFATLDFAATAGMKRSKDWPNHVIAMSKRLLTLQAGLLTQGVSVQLSRGKNRMVTVTAVEVNNEV